MDTNWVRTLNSMKPNFAPVWSRSNRKIYVATDSEVFVYSDSGKRSRSLSHPELGKAGWVVDLVIDTETSQLIVGSSDRPVVIAFNPSDTTNQRAIVRKLPTEEGAPGFPAINREGIIYLAGKDYGRLRALRLGGLTDVCLPYDRGSDLYDTNPVLDDSGFVYIVSREMGYGLLALAQDTSFHVRWRKTNIRTSSKSRENSLAFGLNGEIYVPDEGMVHVLRHQPLPDSLLLLPPKMRNFCLGDTLISILEVRVRDQYGDPLDHHPVTFHVVASNKDSTINTEGDGLARFPWHLEARVGMQEVHVRSFGRNGQPLASTDTTFTAIVRAGQIDVCDSINFGEVTLGENSTETISIKNTGECSLKVFSTNIIDDSDSGFSLINPVAGNIVIAPKDSLLLSIEFHPKKAARTTLV